MRRYRQVAAYILVGGASSRMGQDKGLLEFGGVPLVVHTARLIEPLVRSVTVVGSPLRYGAHGLREIADQRGIADLNGREGRSREPSRGPLAGITAALADTHSLWNLILACDLPHLSATWLDWLLSRAVQSRAQVVIPRTGRGLEPLAAAYHRECRAAIAAALARGVRKVTDALEGLHLEVLHQREWRHLDPCELVLTNMNTPQDYRKALKVRVESSRDGKQIKHVRPARQQKP